MRGCSSEAWAQCLFDPFYLMSMGTDLLLC